MAVLSVGAGPLHGQEIFHRLFDTDHGLNPPSVRSLAQDRTGFIWIGTEGGLFRYDGVEMQRWAGSSLDRTITRVIVSPEGAVAALRLGALFLITSVGAEPIVGPAGRPIESARDAAFDGSGGLWVIRNEEVWRRDPGGGWTQIKLPEGERPFLIRPHVGDSIHLATNRAVWRLTPANSPERILPDLAKLMGSQELLVDVHTTEEGRVLALSFLGRVLELTDAGPRELFRTEDLGAPGRAISIADRAGILWVSIDRQLVGWRADGHSIVLSRDQGVESGGPLLVDHEGSLWMGSFVGLYQFPEPGTRLWTERSGLPSSHVRYLARTGDTVWITSWYGAGYLRRGPQGWQVGTVSGWTPSPLLVDSRGVLWAGSDHGLLEVQDGEVIRRHLSGMVILNDLHEAEDGTLWLATDIGLFRADFPGRRLREIPVPAFDGGSRSVESVLIDRQGFLWTSKGEPLCHAPVRRLRSPGEPDWSCETIPGAVHVSGGSLVEMPSGALWLSTNRLGVLRRVEERWEPVPGVWNLPSRSILSLVPSRSGGVWIVGHGALHRVREAVDDSLGWQIVERLTAWHGLPVTSGTHLLEDPDGGLWVTTSLGVTYVPPAARTSRLDPPRVALVDVRVDNRPVRWQSTLHLPHDRNRLELRFAALSYRDPSLIRYQVRLSPSDPWVGTAGEPYFRWVDLPAGDYSAEVRASLDGESWTSAPAHFSFRVSPPWYREPWAAALFLFLTALALYGAHRLRVAHLLDLERQRTRIAMDLHDEIGSGLGSIGILSGLLTTERLDPDEERRMAREIAATTGQLGAALSQIVWALDPRAKTMKEVAGRMAEFGHRLFARDTTRFTTRFPERWPAASPSQLVRRNVMLIGLEALHNAVRHAHASKVELCFNPMADGMWRLVIDDDGVGITSTGNGANGVGLRSMRLRAEEIDAELSWSSPKGRGTTVSLTFRAHPHRMIMRWERRRRPVRLGE